MRVNSQYRRGLHACIQTMINYHTIKERLGSSPAIDYGPAILGTSAPMYYPDHERATLPICFTVDVERACADYGATFKTKEWTDGFKRQHIDEEFDYNNIRSVELLQDLAFLGGVFTARNICPFTRYFYRVTA